MRMGISKKLVHQDNACESRMIGIDVHIYANIASRVGKWGACYIAINGKISARKS